MQLPDLYRMHAHMHLTTVTKPKVRKHGDPFPNQGVTLGSPQQGPAAKRLPTSCGLSYLLNGKLSIVDNLDSKVRLALASRAVLAVKSGVKRAMQALKLSKS